MLAIAWTWTWWSETLVLAIFLAPFAYGFVDGLRSLRRIADALEERKLP